MFLPFLALKSQKCKHENWNGGVAFDWQVDVIVSALLGVSSYCDLSSTFDWTFGLDTGWTRISSLGSNVLDRSGTFSWSVDLQISQHPSGPTRFLHGGGACWKKMRSDEILPGKHLELLKETADSGVLSLALIWSPPSGGASHAGLLLRRWNVLLLLWRLLVSLCRSAPGSRAGEDAAGEEQGAGGLPAADVHHQRGAGAGDRGESQENQENHSWCSWSVSVWKRGRKLLELETFCWSFFSNIWFVFILKINLKCWLRFRRKNILTPTSHEHSRRRNRLRLDLSFQTGDDPSGTYFTIKAFHIKT